MLVSIQIAYDQQFFVDRILETGRGSNKLSPSWCLEGIGRYDRFDRLGEAVLNRVFGEICEHLRLHVLCVSGERRMFNGYRLWEMRHAVVERLTSEKWPMPGSDWQKSAGDVCIRYDDWYPLPGNGRAVVEEFEMFDIRGELEQSMVADGVPQFPRAELVCLVDILRRLELCEQWSVPVMEELFLGSVDSDASEVDFQRCAERDPFRRLEYIASKHG